MRMRTISLLVLLISSLAGFASAAKYVRHVWPSGANFPDSSVSIVSDGFGADRIAELARAYDAAGLPRVLPVAGLGPIADARALMHMRGIDLAVLDADILVYGRLTGELQGIEARLAAVMKLADKTVYVVAAPGVDTLADLVHQKVLSVGAGSDAEVTARTVFSLLSIDAVLGATDQSTAGEALANGSAKAVVLVLAPGEPGLGRLPKDKGLHLLPAPDSAALDAVYSRTTITEADAPGLTPEGGVPVLKVASLLVTYAWRPNLYRYGSVQQFLQALPRVLTDLRKGGSAAFWLSADAHAVASGWQPYAGATAALAGVAPAEPQLPAVALATAVATPSQPSPTPTKPAAVTTPPRPAVKPFESGIDLIAVPLPGLSDPRATGGGLIPELMGASLPGEQLRLAWATDSADAAAKLGAGGSGPRLAFPLHRPDCAIPANASVCEHLVFSKPVFEALDVFFARSGSDFAFTRDEDVAGRSVCAAAGTDVSTLDAAGRRWLSQDLITLLRRPSFADCLAALDQGNVDAVFGDQLEGEGEIEAAGLAGHIAIVDRPVAVRDLVAAAAKSDSAASDAVSRLDAGVAALKATGHYSDIVLSRLTHGASAGSKQAVR